MELPHCLSLWWQRVCTLGSGQICWLLAHLALVQAIYALLIPSAPKTTQTAARFSKNAPGHFITAAETKLVF